MIHRSLSHRTSSLIATIAISAIGGCSPLEIAGRNADTARVGQGVEKVRAVVPWTSSATKLPQEFVQEIKFLHEHGLGDPRGGKYGSAQLVIGNVWNGGDRPVEAHGWVLPDGRFLAWNGIVYKPASLGPKLDIAEDIQETLIRLSLRPRFNHPTNERFGAMAPAGETASLSLLSAGLLLLDGREDLAEEVWGAENGDQQIDVPEHLLTGFASARFDRAITAHMRGDDQLSLDEAKSLQKDRSSYEKEALEVMSDSRRRMLTQAAIGGPGQRTALGFLAPLDELVTDEARRVARGVPAEADIKAIAALPPEQRVKKIIDNLDQVSAQQMSQPGGVALGMDPLVQALVEVGPAAAPALLDCMEHDTRLTRSVGFGRAFFPYRSLVSVRIAAYTAFESIYQISSFPGFDGTNLPVAALRAFYEKNRGLSGADILFGRLADDAAGRNAWREASQLIVESSAIHHIGQSLMARVSDSGSAPIKGAALRAKTNPSVSELMARRVKQIIANNGEPLAFFRFEDALRIAISLAKWDPVAAKPVLAETCEAAAQTLKNWYHDSNIVGLFGTASAWRIKLGDDKALALYSSTLKSLKANELFGFEAGALAPLWWFPNDPTVQALARKLFSDGQGSAGLNSSEFFRMAISPIVRSDGYRERLGAFLRDKSVVDDLHWDEAQPPTLRCSGQAFSIDIGDRDAPRKGEMRKLRTCDFAADSFNIFKGAPKFRVYWSELKKDAAILEIQQFLRSNGPKLAERSAFWRPYENDAP